MTIKKKKCIKLVAEKNKAKKRFSFLNMRKTMIIDI